MPKLTAGQEEDFARYARNPETWALAARRQLAVALHLFAHEAALRKLPRASFEEMSGCHYAAYLHAGFAAENAAKAALVFRDSSVITEHGTIDRSKLGLNGGHGVRSIAELVLSDWPTEDLTLLDKLQEYVVWAGRYTVPMNGEVLFDEARMNVLRNSPFGEQDQIARVVARLLNAAIGVREE